MTRVPACLAKVVPTLGESKRGWRERERKKESRGNLSPRAETGPGAVPKKRDRERWTDRADISQVAGGLE